MRCSWIPAWPGPDQIQHQHASLFLQNQMGISQERRSVTCAVNVDDVGDSDRSDCKGLVMTFTCCCRRLMVAFRWKLCSGLLLGMLAARLPESVSLRCTAPLLTNSTTDDDMGMAMQTVLMTHRTHETQYS